jgi:hypothetical protein
MANTHSPNGGPAFPAPTFAVPRDLGDEKILQLKEMQGMTLRDYFAAKAPFTLADAVVAADLESGAPDVETAVNRVLMDGVMRAKAMAMLAQLRQEYADAMLKAREQ